MDTKCSACDLLRRSHRDHHYVSDGDEVAMNQWIQNIHLVTYSESPTVIAIMLVSHDLEDW